MLAIHHLPGLIPNRLASALKRLEEAIWRDFTSLQVEATAAGPKQRTLAQAKRLPRRPVRAGALWGRLFDQRWCRIAQPAGSREGFLNWRDQGEATLHVDGKSYFGFDVAHRFCRLPRAAREIWIESNCVQSAIWHPDATGLDQGGSRFDGAFLCWA